MKIFGIRIFKNKKLVKDTIKQEESLITIEAPRELAKIVIMPKLEQEYMDLEEKHSEFFSEEKSPKLQMQSKIGEQEEALNIKDVTLSRSDKFFKQAPVVNTGNYPDFFEETEEILQLEKYMGIPVEEEQI